MPRFNNQHGAVRFDFNEKINITSIFCAQKFWHIFMDNWNIFDQLVDKRLGLKKVKRSSAAYLDSTE